MSRVTCLGFTRTQHRTDDDGREEPEDVVPARAHDAVGRLTSSWDVLVGAQRRLHEVRERTHRNFDGGDAGHQWDHGLVVRHAVNYAVAVAVLAQVEDSGAVVDVGAGAGGFSVWAADALGRDLVIVDQDEGHRDLAGRAFPQVRVCAQMMDVEPAPTVACMEVVEHVPADRQHDFVAELGSLVEPGGALAMSTPDESGYWRGWSGYRPHVATLDAAGLDALCRAALPGWTVEVVRISGPGFALSPVARVGVPVANRVWGWLEDSLPALSAELAYRMNQAGRRRSDPPPPDPGLFDVTAPSEGDGTGLLAWARRPR